MLHFLTLNCRRTHRTSAWTLVTAAQRRLLGISPARAAGLSPCSAMRARPNSTALKKRERFLGRSNFAHPPALSASPRKYFITPFYYIKDHRISPAAPQTSQYNSTRIKVCSCRAPAFPGRRRRIYFLTFIRLYRIISKINIRG